MKEVLACIGLFYIWGALSQYFTNDATGRIIGWILYSPVAYLLLIIGALLLGFCLPLMFLTMGANSLHARIGHRITGRIVEWFEQINDWSNNNVAKALTARGLIITSMLVVTGYGFYMYSTLAPLYVIAKRECPRCTIIDVIEYKALEDLASNKRQSP